MYQGARYTSGRWFEYSTRHVGASCRPCGTSDRRVCLLSHGVVRIPSLQTHALDGCFMGVISNCPSVPGIWPFSWLRGSFPVFTESNVYNGWRAFTWGWLRQTTYIVGVCQDLRRWSGHTLGPADT